MKRYIVPWTLDRVDLGSNVLEVGPGYGATTSLLCQRVTRLTCLEVDAMLAAYLRRRIPSPNVTILCEDATRMSLADESFDAAVCFTMLHHVQSANLQNQLFAEVARVLQPGGTFAGTDSLDSRFFRWLHIFNTAVVVPPETIAARLGNAGFDDVEVDVNPYAFKFRARKPQPA